MKPNEDVGKGISRDRKGTSAPLHPYYSRVNRVASLETRLENSTKFKYAIREAPERRAGPGPRRQGACRRLSQTHCRETRTLSRPRLERRTNEHKKRINFIQEKNDTAAKGTCRVDLEDLGQSRVERKKSLQIPKGFGRFSKSCRENKGAAIRAVLVLYLFLSFFLKNVSFELPVWTRPKHTLLRRTGRRREEEEKKTPHTPRREFSQSARRSVLVKHRLSFHLDQTADVRRRRVDSIVFGRWSVWPQTRANIVRSARFLFRDL